VVAALGLLGHGEGEQAFLQLTAHGAPEVRAAAVEALGRLGASAPT